MGNFGACKKCMKKAEAIVEIYERKGLLMKTYDAKLDWFINKIIESRKNEIPN